MKVKELLKILENNDPEAELEITYPVSWLSPRFEIQEIWANTDTKVLHITVQSSGDE
jgi:hypothetical protein